MRSLPSLSWAVIALTVCSCTTYQHVTLSSQLHQNATHEFIYESDSILIKYNFNGENCPVSLHLENKLNIPLFINWQRSSIIQNNQSMPYWQDKSIVRGTAEGTSTSSLSYPQDFLTTTDINVSIYRNESITFLPPQSYKADLVMTLESDMILTPEPKQNYNETISTASGKVKAYRYTFEKENSPRRYRSFLTLSANSSGEPAFTIEHEFWVSEITETWLGPSSFSKERNRGNEYYLKKSNGAGVALGVTTLLFFVLAAFHAQ